MDRELQTAIGSAIGNQLVHPFFFRDIQHNPCIEYTAGSAVFVPLDVFGTIGIDVKAKKARLLLCVCYQRLFCRKFQF